jgi:hypothetical protein
MGRPARHGGAPRVEELKLCDLCGGLTLQCNSACHVCGWRGHFETGAELVGKALERYRRDWGEPDRDAFQAPERIRAKASNRFISRVRAAVERIKIWLFG